MSDEYIVPRDLVINVAPSQECTNTFGMACLKCKTSLDATWCDEPTPTLRIVSYCKLQVSFQVSLFFSPEFQQHQEKLKFIATTMQECRSGSDLMQCGWIRLTGNAKLVSKPPKTVHLKSKVNSVGYSTPTSQTTLGCCAVPRSLPKVVRILSHCVAPANFFKLGISESSNQPLRVKRMCASSMSWTCTWLAARNERLVIMICIYTKYV